MVYCNLFIYVVKKKRHAESYTPIISLAKYRTDAMSEEGEKRC